MINSNIAVVPLPTFEPEESSQPVTCGYRASINFYLDSNGFMKEKNFVFEPVCHEPPMLDRTVILDCTHCFARHCIDTVDYKMFLRETQVYKLGCPFTVGTPLWMLPEYKPPNPDEISLLSPSYECACGRGCAWGDPKCLISATEFIDLDDSIAKMLSDQTDTEFNLLTQYENSPRVKEESKGTRDVDTSHLKQ